MDHQASHKSTGCAADSLKLTTSPTRLRLGLPHRSEQQGARGEQLQKSQRWAGVQQAGEPLWGPWRGGLYLGQTREPLRAEQSSDGLLAASPRSDRGRPEGRELLRWGVTLSRSVGRGQPPSLPSPTSPIGWFRQAGRLWDMRGSGRGLHRALSTGLVIKPHLPGQPRPQLSHPDPLCFLSQASVRAWDSGSDR